MNLQEKIIEFIEKYSLKEKAMNNIDSAMDASIEADKEIGIDFLEGHARSELIYEFGRYEFQIDKNDRCRIVTKINIYSKKLFGPNFDIPVGYYEEWTNLTGEHLDEYLIFDWTVLQQLG